MSSLNKLQIHTDGQMDKTSIFSLIFVLRAYNECKVHGCHDVTSISRCIGKTLLELLETNS
jgi:hypothetical protein